MELPQSWPLEAEGRKPTHDFLSLYSHSSVQQDRRPPSQGGYLKTHDFLHLELGKTIAKEETPVEEAMTEKPPPPTAPPRSAGNILPGGIGTYNISHKTEGPLFTTVAQWNSSERNDETSNCSSYSGNGFTLWEDSAATKGKTRKENTGKTPAISEELRVKVDGKRAVDQMANAPRSKHSATEQRRRSKINDRFQMLRGIMPNSDQKRDKASFLLEVVEYIQSLQEKVQKYEGAYQGWNHEPSKMMPWSNNERPTEDHADQYRDINGVSTPALFFSVAPNIAGAAMNPVQSDMRSATTSRSIDLGPVMMNKAMPFLVSPKPNLITSAPSTCRLPSDAEANGALPIKSPKQHELTVEGGTISISSTYSQGLLSTLTRTLQTSGVDLSNATISVQIDIGKQSRL